ncbi:MAG: T9SS type B sorting domain-containing protein [Algibacter sp.]
MRKKSLLIITFLFLIPFISWSQTTPIPDNNFEIYLETHDANLNLVTLGNTNSMGDGILNNSVPTNKINTVLDLDILNLNITNLSGIEDFIALTKLDCSQNQLTNLDVTSLSNLQILWCFSNSLSNIDVSQNTALISLRVEDNTLINLDVSNNTVLNVLTCQNNFLTSLNTSNNSNLTILNCGDNATGTIDVTNNLNLVSLTCPRNNLTELDVTNNINLEQLMFADNQINDINISNNRELSQFRGSRNLLRVLDTSNNLELIHITCNFNTITELDISNNNKLGILDCSNNLLCRINAKNGTNMLITNFNADNNPNLTCIIVDDINYSNTNWTDKDATATFYNSITDCENSEAIIPEVDNLNDFIGPSYTLPILTNGNYYTTTDGNGINLNTGDVISTSQTIYIYNETVCSNNESSFNILITDTPYFIPKYFTPNNDGNHDYWKVYDSTNTITNIYIFNRYGKLLKDLNINSEGWNGTFNGELLPNNDYWYNIIFNSGEVLNGHFTLKR